MFVGSTYPKGTICLEQAIELLHRQRVLNASSTKVLSIVFFSQLALAHLRCKVEFKKYIMFITYLASYEH
jgi:hypothetical protein